MTADLDDLGESGVKRVCKANMAYHPPLEECKRAHTLGAIDDLVRHDKVSRLDLLLQTTYGRKGNDSLDTKRPQRSNVGAVRHLVRRQFVVKSMARDEGDGDGLSGRG